MNLIDFIIIAAIGVAVVFTVMHLRKNKGGCGSCSGCSMACAKNNAKK